jgi:hypothetical protein
MMLHLDIYFLHPLSPELLTQITPIISSKTHTLLRVDGMYHMHVNNLI